MKLNQNFLIVCLVLVLTYAAGITYGIGPSRLAERINKRIIAPVMDEILDRRPDLADYAEKICPTDDAIAIAYFGQSNATNTVEPKANLAIPSNLLQYDWKSSKCFAYREPLLGADFTRGNNITYAAARIANESDKTVVVIPFGFGPSTVLEWAYGQGASQHNIVLKRLKESGLSPQVFLWHQGESDVPLDGLDENNLGEIPYFQRPTRPLDEGMYRIGLSYDAYKNALNEVIQRTLRAYPDARFGIALVSLAPCLGRNEIWQPVRQAQQDVAMSDARTFISADSDRISGIANRYDTCHFSDEGAKKLSAEYYQSISSLNVF